MANWTDEETFKVIEWKEAEATGMYSLRFRRGWKTGVSARLLISAQARLKS